MTEFNSITYEKLKIDLYKLKTKLGDQEKKRIVCLQQQKQIKNARHMIGCEI